MDKRWNTPTEAVKGTQDILPESFRQYRDIILALSDCFESFGYQPVDVPIIEHLELYLKKSGEDIRAKMYAFKDLGHRDLCLRPELTASIVRAYVANMQSLPRPVRLYYSGPAFRYDKPQRGRFRQFTQVGTELLGTKSSYADAECIHLACKGMEALGLKDFRLSIGNIGVTLGLLDTLDLDEHMKLGVVESLESLRKHPDALEELRGRLSPDSATSWPDADAELEGIGTVLNGGRLDRESAKELVGGLLAVTRPYFASAHDRDEIVDRMLLKVQRRSHRAEAEKVLEFVGRLCQVHGTPDDVLSKLDELLGDYGLDRTPKKELQGVLAALRHYDIPWSRTEIDLGFGRGLQYYTGVIFELSCDELGAEKQVCGGGRYDDLVASLGGAQCPALGFAYGLERLALLRKPVPAGATTSGAEHGASRGWLDALLVAIGEENQGMGVQMAHKMRERGWKIEVALPDRSMRRRLQRANRLGASFVLFVGSEEVQRSAAKVRRMSDGRERFVAFSDLGRLSTDELSSLFREMA